MQPYRGSLMIAARLREETKHFAHPYMLNFFPSDWVHVGKTPNPFISFLNQHPLLYFIVAIQPVSWQTVFTETCIIIVSSDHGRHTTNTVRKQWSCSQPTKEKRILRHRPPTVMWSYQTPSFKMQQGSRQMAAVTERQTEGSEWLGKMWVTG
jgi:hypothetical protein